jgi:hypothetical protein
VLLLKALLVRKLCSCGFNSSGRYCCWEWQLSWLMKLLLQMKLLHLHLLHLMILLLHFVPQLIKHNLRLLLRLGLLCTRQLRLNNLFLLLKKRPVMIMLLLCHILLLMMCCC